MAPGKVDGVIETVRYDPQGKITLLRMYERRGPTWSDRVLLTREDLVARIKKGQRFYTGSRIPLMGGSFNYGSPLRLRKVNGTEILLSGFGDTSRDMLDGVPVF
jgi:hypothetical protein